jgi:hypothetical protein
MKSDWIWMPHAGHLVIGDMCKFRLNTYVNGYIVSTVGEYWPDEAVRRIYLDTRRKYPKLEIAEDGKVISKTQLNDENIELIKSLKGDHFDEVYLKFFGYEEVGLNRLYESMVFKARESKDTPCCPWVTDSGGILDMQGYNDPKEAFDGHVALCEKWDKE